MEAELFESKVQAPGQAAKKSLHSSTGQPEIAPQVFQDAIRLYWSGRGLIFVMQKNLELDDKRIEATVKLGNFKSKPEAINMALARFVQRRQWLRILDLGVKIGFDPKWQYKKMRRNRS